MSSEHPFALLDVIPVGSFVINKDRVVVFWNSCLEQWTGIQREQIVGRPIDQHFPHLRAAKYAARIQNLFEDGIPVVFSSYLHKYIIPVSLPDGQFQVQHTIATRISSSPSEESYALFTIQDVTELAQRLKDYRIMRDQAHTELCERLAVEDALKHAKMNLENIFHAAMPLCVTLKNFEISQVNDAYCDFFGIPKYEALGKKCYTAHPAMACHTEQCPLQKIINGAEHVEYEVAKTLADGTTIWCIVTAKPYRDLNGELIGMVENFQDITRRKHAEDAIQEARRVAEDANQAKGRFLANMSHELRTPLNVILGFSQMMQRNRALPPEDYHRLNMIIQSGEHLLTLINQVLDWSKTEVGKVTLDETPVDVAQLLYEIVELFKVRAEEHGVYFQYEPARNLPQTILADGVKLRQILLNLLSNAIKFTKTGGIRLRVRAEFPEEYPAQMRLICEVQDTGMGISAAELPMLFESFSQTMAGQQHREGTGLGLAISRKLARMMRGDITVQSEEGQGSCFTCAVIVTPIKETDKPIPRVRRQVVAVQRNDQFSLKDYRMLIVDEHPTNRQLLCQLFQPFGFDLREAQNGAEAVALWEDWQPHVIWMDLWMPEMDGFEVTRRIREAEMRRKMAHAESSLASWRTIIFALTASMFEQEEERARLAGCDGFLRKPYREAEIFDMLAKHTDIHVIYETFSQDALFSSLTAIRDAKALSIAMKDVPAQTLQELRYAAMTTDLTILSTIINLTIAPVNEALAETLNHMLNDFEYMTILEAINLVLLTKTDSTGIIANQISLDTL
ncbi:hybrid sensory kinase [Candidatus Moduliflexus flocculans]|uniref:histidine kinase n=1 Tax=Candidatus Moduliflexus flocculans TaxID=1499966 RepID=A0A081BM88_9BACT|nr:hybrid sensory kinase [Candidatus Moduliflexus flocculans]